LLHANAPQPFSDGDKVFAISKLSVYLTLDTTTNPVEELTAGIGSHIIKAQVDTNGLLWVYLADNAFGWVPTAVGGSPTLRLYSDATYQKFIDDQTAAIKNNAQDTDAYVARAMAYRFRHQFTEALADRDMAYKLATNDAAVLDSLAKIDLDASQY